MKKINPRVFFDIEVGGIPMGRIVFELFADIQPKTCQNFHALTTGKMGIGATTGKPLHYKNSIFHRVVKNFMIQGGDFSTGNGTGGESIYGGTFPDESFELMHDKPFLLSMANRGKDTNGSQFFITTQVAPHLDNIHVVFGRVVSGSEIVSHIEGLPVDHVSRPLTEVKIVNCGELVLKSKSKKAPRDSSTSSSSCSDEKYQKRKKKRKNKKRSKSSERAAEKKSEDKNSGHRHPLVSVTEIDPDEIPDVPSNRFLFRAGLKNNSNQTEYSQTFSRDRARNIRNRGAGRIFKGRGIFRYRTPSRSRSRSPTPPHWKQAQNRTVKLQDIKKRRDNKAYNDCDYTRRFVEISEEDDSKRFSRSENKNDYNSTRKQANEKTSERNHNTETEMHRQYRSGERSRERNWRQEESHDHGQRHKKSCDDWLKKSPHRRNRERSSRKNEK